MRAEDPVHWNPDWNAWILTRYAEVAAVLKDSRVSVTRGMGESLPPEPLRQEFCGLLDMLASQMVFSDPPNHTRLRALVSKAFSARTIEAMRPRIEQIVNAALDRVEPAGKMEVIQDLAYPLPITVIAEMLGVPAEDRPLLRKWSDAFFAFLEGATTLAQDQAVLRSMAEMTDYFRHLIASRAQTPQDDLLNALASAREQGDALSEAELYGNCLLLLAAGHETTVNLIGNGLLALLRHPAQHRLLRENPDLAASAVEEFLRYDCPVQWTERRATADLLVGGKQVAKGQSLHIGLGAANRDPAQFPDPDRLDITRRENRHVAFGHGIHFCAGAALARLEGQIAFRTLLRRFPSLRLDTDTVFWQKDSAFRRLQTLPVVWT
jgi:cytochrome P450